MVAAAVQRIQPGQVQRERRAEECTGLDVHRPLSKWRSAGMGRKRNAALIFAFCRSELPTAVAFGASMRGKQPRPFIAPAVSADRLKHDQSLAVIRKYGHTAP
jgi:hypothetical protein